MAPIKCAKFAEIKYQGKTLNLLHKLGDNASPLPELWIPFDDIAGILSRGNHAESRADLLSAWKDCDKVKQVHIADVASLPAVGQNSLFKLIYEAKASEAFCEWLTKNINIELEKLMKAEATIPLKQEIVDLTAELDKWRGGKQDTVYILNFYPYDDGIYKIGLTDKIERRVADLNTGTPSEIIVEYKRDCGNKRIVEQLMHYILEKYRVNPNKEFFRIQKHIAVGLLDSVVDYVDGLHELMSEQAKQARGGVIADGGGGDLTHMIDSFKTVSVNRARSFILPDLTHAAAHPAAPLYPQAAPFAHPLPEYTQFGAAAQWNGLNPPPPAQAKKAEKQHRWPFW